MLRCRNCSRSLTTAASRLIWVSKFSRAVLPRRRRSSGSRIARTNLSTKSKYSQISSSFRPATHKLPEGAVQFETGSGEDRTYYVNLRSSSSMRIGLTLWSVPALSTHSSDRKVRVISHQPVSRMTHRVRHCLPCTVPTRQSCAQVSHRTDCSRRLVPLDPL